MPVYEVSSVASRHSGSIDVVDTDDGSMTVESMVVPRNIPVPKVVALLDIVNDVNDEHL